MFLETLDGLVNTARIISITDPQPSEDGSRIWYRVRYHDGTTVQETEALATEVDKLL